MKLLTRAVATLAQRYASIDLYGFAQLRAGRLSLEGGSDCVPLFRSHPPARGGDPPAPKPPQTNRQEGFDPRPREGATAGPA